MVCCNCQNQARKAGRDRLGRQRYKCRVCRRYSTEARTSPLGKMRLDPSKAAHALHLLCEGNSVRAVSRSTGIHQATLLRLLVETGERCERLLEERISGLPVEHVEADELWTWVGAKARTQKWKQLSPDFGDCYTYLALEEKSKLLLTWHCGRRSADDTHDFMGKLARATSGRFQLSTDGWHAYPRAAEYHLGARVDHCAVVKTYVSAGGEEARRYAPPRLLTSETVVVSGTPDGYRASTSHVERLNWTVRTDLRRFTRLSNGFSRKRENLRAAVALWACYYNFVKRHAKLRMPPAMKAGLIRRPWTMADLLEAAAAAA
ncbi:MAG TPA: hypothetical protein VNJ70_07050 [Thermoanaerobaculia bacterium]|nr:hypothetical protein [Thermoanaerobaculia bacterium]